MINGVKSFLLVHGDPEAQCIFYQALYAVDSDALFFTTFHDSEAVQIMEDDELAPDCVVVELSMPGIDALDFLRRVGKIARSKNIPIIVHAPEPVPHRVTELLESGAFALYFGPFSRVSARNILNLYLQPTLATCLN